MFDPLDGKRFKVIRADCLTALKELPDGCIQTVITSPPY